MRYYFARPLFGLGCRFSRSSQHTLQIARLEFRTRDHGMEVAADKATWHVPPADILFVQRKISGTTLLAARLQVRVDVRELARQALGGTAERAIARAQ